LEKSKNRHISATVRSIATKFGMAKQFNPLERPTVKISNFETPRWRRPPSWKIEELPYLGRGLTDFDQIWHDNAL